MRSTHISSDINVQGLKQVHLNSYTLPEVVTELIDNSLDSHLKSERSDKLIIDINFDERGEVIYQDNANGFSYKNFESAFQTYFPNENEVVYGTYGVGMKHALLWLGEYTTIESLSLEELVGYRTVYPNIDAGIIQSTLVLDSDVELDLGLFNTRFTIHNARVERYSKKALRDLVFSLSEIYSYYKDILRLTINSEEILFEKPYKILHSIPFDRYKSLKSGGTNKFCLIDPNSPKLEWKFSFDHNDDISIRSEGGKHLQITGYIGIKEGTDLPSSGLRIFRNNRCVLGYSANDRYRPFGQANTYLAKVIVGEIHLHGFDKVTIGKSLPEFNKLQELLQTLQSSVKTNPRYKENEVARKFFSHADKFRLNSHPNAPLCSELPKDRSVVKGSGKTDATKGTSDSTKIHEPRVEFNEHKVLDQKYRLEQVLIPTKNIKVSVTNSDNLINIKLECNRSINQISAKLMMELFDTFFRTEPITGVNALHEFESVIRRLL